MVEPLTIVAIQRCIGEQMKVVEPSMPEFARIVRLPRCGSKIPLLWSERSLGSVPAGVSPSNQVALAGRFT